MSAMLRDYYVEFRREDDIAETALAWRRASRNENLAYFNVVDFVVDVLQKQLKKGPILIEFFDAEDGADPAYVTFNPLTLHVDRETWDLAKLGDPDARFVIAHEVGHLILHDHHAKAFSRDPNAQIKFAEDEHSAEWQANVFAYYFLLPTHIVAAFADVGELARACGVSQRLAQERHVVVMLANVRHAQYVRSSGYLGDACGCGNFALVPRGLFAWCEVCGRRQALDRSGR